MSMTVYLNSQEIEVLDRQDTNSENAGGWQSLLVRLQRILDRNSGALTLEDDDLERIHRYAFVYGSGGWEQRLLDIFERHLGPNLDQRQ